MDTENLFNVKVRSSVTFRTHFYSLTIIYLILSQGKVVLVTGGAKGIGRMISQGYVTNGATVYIASRDAKACEKAVSELNALGKGKAYFIPANFYNEDDCKKLAEELGKRESSKQCLEFWLERLCGEPHPF